MFRAAIISQDEYFQNQLQSTLRQTGQVTTLRVYERYPRHIELTRFVRARGLQVVFLSMESLSEALGIVQLLEAEFPGIQTVAIHRDPNREGLVELLRAGVRDCLFRPHNQVEVQEIIDRISARLKNNPIAAEMEGAIYSFLPAKAGVGASTVALNSALALSRTLGEGVLLADLDLNSGMLQFMLKLAHAKSIKEAAEWAIEMDESVWPKLVATTGKLDVLPAGPLDPEFRMGATQIAHLAEFWRRTYRAVCVDLSGDMELHSLEVLQESKQILLVCTPEMPSLHQAQEKHRYLRKLGVGDRVKLVVNRQSRKAVLSARQVGDLVRAPVFAEIVNDYAGVHRALLHGRGVDPSSTLGKQFAKLAISLPGPKPSKSQTGSKVLDWLSKMRKPDAGYQPVPAPSKSLALSIWRRRTG